MFNIIFNSQSFTRKSRGREKFFPQSINQRRWKVNLSGHLMHELLFTRLIYSERFLLLLQLISDISQAKLFVYFLSTEYPVWKLSDFWISHSMLKMKRFFARFNEFQKSPWVTWFWFNNIKLNNKSFLSHDSFMRLSRTTTTFIYFPFCYRTILTTAEREIVIKFS